MMINWDFLRSNRLLLGSRFFRDYVDCAMTEADLLELISIHRTESGFHSMNFIALMSGYIAAAYFAGRKLTTFQMSALTFVYTAIVPFPIIGSMQAGHSAVQLFEKYGNLIDKPLFFDAVEAGPMVIGSINAVSWAVSIFFMLSIRKMPSDEKST